jgi:hypothetical protein
MAIFSIKGNKRLGVENPREIHAKKGDEILS